MSSNAATLCSSEVMSAPLVLDEEVIVTILSALVAMLPALATIACELAAVALYTTSMTWPAFSHSAEQSNKNSSICSRSQFLVGSIVGMSLGSELGDEVVSGAFSYRSLAQLPPVPASQLEAVPKCVAALRLLLHRHSPLLEAPPC